MDMFRCPTSHYVNSVAAILLGMATLAGPVRAQMQQTGPTPAAPPAPVIDKRPVEQTSMGMLEGTAKKVDPADGTLQVSTGPIGVLRKTLEVTGDTKIQVEGRQATLSDIREGETVRASYETREAKNVATHIEVIRSQPAEKGGANR